MADTVPIVRGRFCLGAKPSPRLALMMAAPHRVLRTPPPQFAVVPKQLDLWGNGDYGDCVTAEEMFAKAVWSLMSGLPELFITAAAAVAWAKENGYLDGAMLTEVMTTMAKKGIVVGGTTYKDGGYTSVDYTDETNLRSSLANGPVKIGIDHAALPDDAGNANGWVGLGGKHNYNNTDHCVGLSGYGPAGWLFQQLGVPLPSTLASDTQGYLLFTWATIGFVDHKWILSTTSESWLRTPTTPGQTPIPIPNPTPGPSPTPITLPWGGLLGLSVDGTNKIVTVTPPEGFDGQINVEPPPYTPG